MNRRSTRSFAAFAAVAVAFGLAAPAGARQTGRRPWLVVVSHRIDLGRIFRGEEVQQAPPSYRRPGQPQQVTKVHNVTAGVIADRAGHVVTRLVNYDPAVPPEEITIASPGGRAVSARLVGMDFPTGFVVLQVSAFQGIEPAPVSAMPALKAGAEVRIISPDFSAAAPARGRSPQSARLLGPAPGRVLEASASPVAGRSGVLCTIASDALIPATDFSLVETPDGVVLGVVKYVAPHLGHLYPIAFVREVAGRVVRMSGHVQPGWLGLDGRYSPGGAAGAPAGFLIESVTAGGPAAEAGLAAGDLVVELDGTGVASERELALALASSPAGSSVELTVVRAGAPRTVRVMLGARPPRKAADRAPNAGPTSGPGLVLLDVSPQLAKHFGADGGALVSEIAPGGAAERSGLKVADLVVRVGATPVANRTDAATALNAAIASGAPTVEVEIRRDGKPLVRTLSLGPEPEKPASR